MLGERPSEVHACGWEFLALRASRESSITLTQCKNGYVVNFIHFKHRFAFLFTISLRQILEEASLSISVSSVYVSSQVLTLVLAEV